jgi:hypothetical protein
MSYITDKDPLILAEEAQQLLDNPLFKATLAEIEAGIIDQMKIAPIIGNPDAEAYRDKLILSLQSIETIKNTIVNFVNTGRIHLSLKQQEEY